MTVIILAGDVGNNNHHDAGRMILSAAFLMTNKSCPWLHKYKNTEQEQQTWQLFLSQKSRHYHHQVIVTSVDILTDNSGKTMKTRMVISSMSSTSQAIIIHWDILHHVWFWCNPVSSPVTSSQKSYTENSSDCLVRWPIAGRRQLCLRREFTRGVFGKIHSRFWREQNPRPKTQPWRTFLRPNDSFVFGKCHSQESLSTRLLHHRSPLSHEADNCSPKVQKEWKRERERESLPFPVIFWRRGTSLFLSPWIFFEMFQHRRKDARNHRLLSEANTQVLHQDVLCFSRYVHCSVLLDLVQYRPWFSLVHSICVILAFRLLSAITSL
jgi:hypothetical protein